MTATRAGSSSIIPVLLRQVSWHDLLHEPLRSAVVVLAVALGVALAFSVQLINQSALGEFSAAVRQVDGQADLELRAQQGGFDERLYARVAAHPQVALASPVVEVETRAFAADGTSLPLRVLGLDALVAAALAPALMPRPDDVRERLAVLDPGAVFLNPAAQRRFGRVASIDVAAAGGARTTLAVRGSVAADGPALVVMDIAGAQALFGRLGRLSRIDLRLAPGADRDALLHELALPAGVQAVAPSDATQRVANVSRAYRVNLTVLALVALFTGAFLVFSVMALSVAKRLPQLALLGVLGLTARERLRLVLAEAGLLGFVGSVLGLALGTALAQLALRLLAGDLGGAYFPGITPTLQFAVVPALLYGALGVLAALAGSWLPARAAQCIAPAQALKGLASLSDAGAPQRAWLAPVLLVLGAVLTQAPPIGGMPLAAYGSVACLLLGGIACVPAGVALMLKLVPPPRHALALLAVERARHQRHTATIAVAGVVASLALSVALTVMVASFRDAVIDWLDSVLPADLYARSAERSGSADTLWLAPEFVAAARALPGVAKLEGQRLVPLQMAPQQPGVTLIARPLPEPERTLPLIGAPVPATPGLPSIWVSEPFARLYDTQPGRPIAVPLPDGRTQRFQVRGTWRDYARQHGALLVDAGDWRRLTGDARVNDLAIWLVPGADAAALQTALRRLAGAASTLEFASARELRVLSLRIFDRSFAVTYWLQAVAVAIGLAGIAASFSAQALARRREFGLLVHLGLTRRQVLVVVAGEGAAWSLAGVAVGLALGLAVAVVLVDVVNPQSFNWTMPLHVPWPRIALLCAAMAAAGTLTAWWAGRAAASRQVALAVKDDW